MQARGIKNAFLKDYNNLKAQTLEKMTPELLCEWIGAPVPNAEERSRFLREVIIVYHLLSSLLFFPYNKQNIIMPTKIHTSQKTNKYMLLLFFGFW